MMCGVGLSREKRDVECEGGMSVCLWVLIGEDEFEEVKRRRMMYKEKGNL